MSTPRSEFLSGLQAELAIALGGIPFGLIYGVLAIDAGLPPALALAMSSIVFAGSAQFIGTQLIAGGALGVVIVATTFVVNLRHLLYSASVAPHIQRLSARWKWLLAYLLTDEAYAVTITRYDRPGESEHRHWFFFGAGVMLWTTWQASTAAGIFLGAKVDPSWSLDFTLALTFIGLVIPALKDRPSVASAASAGLVAVAAFNLPYKLGLMLAALTGIAVGLWHETRQSGALRLRPSRLGEHDPD